MDPVNLAVTARTNHGKGAAKAIRREGNVPAVLYGNSVEPVSLIVSVDEYTKAIDTPYHKNTLLSIEVDGTKHLALTREVQRDPVREDILHVDLWVVQADQTIEASVPLTVEGRSIGIQLGGSLQKTSRRLNVACLPGNIPHEVTVDITELDVGDGSHVSDLPEIEGVSYLHPDNMVVAQVVATREVDEDEEGEEGEEGAEGAEEGGEEAKPEGDAAKPAAE